MRFEWVNLLWVVLPALGLVAWQTRRFEPAGRWLIRGGVLLLALAAMGPQLRYERPLRIAVLVDYSPSTRGALFRDPARLKHRVDTLLGNRDRQIVYFSDGAVPSPAEVAADQTRLPEIDADAVLIFSDGRFEPRTGLPPVFAVVDAGLDYPLDARVERIQIDRERVRIAIHGEQPETRITLRGTDLGELSAVAGDSVVSAGVKERVVIASIARGSDAWPENDRLQGIAADESQRPVWMIEDAGKLPADVTAYAEPAAIVLTDANVNPLQQRNLATYVRDLGGSLILAGAPANFPPAVRRIAPLHPDPPRSGTRLTVLLDSSGSMANRWAFALDAATSAIAGLDETARVTVARFSREAEILITDATPEQAQDELRALRPFAPAGPTGIEAALDSIAGSTTPGSRRLLVISDADATIRDRVGLTQRLGKAGVSVFLLGVGQSDEASDLKSLCETTGGQLTLEPDTRLWTRRLENFASGGDSGQAVSGRMLTSGRLSDIEVGASLRFRGFLRQDAIALASDGEHTVAGQWRVGLGWVTSVALKCDESMLRTIAGKLQRPPADPRFEVEWDVARDRLRVRAAEQSRPLNGLRLSLRRTDADRSEQIPLVQVAPGEYESPLQRRPTATIGQVMLDEQLIITRAIEGRYPQEFDRIGNDRVALTELARSTGGKLVLPEDESTIDLPRVYGYRGVRSLLGAGAFVLLGAGLIFVRAPYLADRMRLMFKRS